MTTWESEVGESDKSLASHQELVLVTIDSMISTGGNRRAHIDWDKADALTLERVQTLAMKITHPGWKHIGWDKYFAEHGDPVTNGRGDVRFQLQGIDGVLVPKEDVREIEFSETIAAQLKQNTNFDAAGALSVEQARENLSNMGSTFMPGGVSSAASSSFGMLSQISGSMGLPAPRQPLALPAAPTPASAPAGIPAPPVQPSGPSAPPSSAGPETERPKKSRAKAKAKPAPAPPAPGTPAPAPRAPSGAGGAQKRGRPAKNIDGELDKLVAEFAVASPSDPLFFGTEAKTAIGKFEALNKGVQQRTQRTTIPAELEHLRIQMKTTSAIHAVLTAIKTNGASSEAFAKVYDDQITLLNLAPTVSLKFPPHILWSRHRMSIQATADDGVWITQVASAALRAAGRSESTVADEQDKFLAERLAGWFRVASWTEMKAALRAFFRPVREFPFEQAPEDF